jgi:hypothetical protein
MSVGSSGSPEVRRPTITPRVPSVMKVPFRKPEFCIKKVGRIYERSRNVWLMAG